MKIFDFPLKHEELKYCVSLIRKGEVGGITTDTVFGMTFDINSDVACKLVSKIKNRENDIFTFHIGDISQLESSDVIFSDHVIDFMRDNLPGPLTVIVDGTLKGVKKSFGIRMPGNKAAREFFKEFRFPSVVATSTNSTGESPLVNKAEVISFLKERISFCVFEDLEELDKKASTIIRLSEKKIHLIREGSLKVDSLNKRALN